VTAGKIAASPKKRASNAVARIIASFMPMFFKFAAKVRGLNQKVKFLAVKKVLKFFLPQKLDF
jgi:hypothetical protein